MPSLTEIISQARTELVQLTGLEAETVILCRREGDGWTIQVDMVEKRVIPPTNDLIATFSATLGPDGSVYGYERIRRYVRGQAEIGE